MINKEFNITKEQVQEFNTRGFLLLKKFYSTSFIDYLQSTIDSRINAPTDKYQTGFSRLAFDMYDGDETIIRLLKDGSFKTVMRDLTNRDMFFAQAIAFELQKLKNKGFPWHIGTQSFGYHKAEDYGCTIWAPLASINPKGQRGGMAYVPKNIISGAYLYNQIDPAVFALLNDRIKNGEQITLEEFVELRDGPVNDPATKKLLDHFAVEDEFDVGDALIFDKYVIHRSVILGEGLLESRAAFVMRFFCETSTYDHDRANDLELPRQHFGYSGPTKFHLEVAKNDGDLLIDSGLFREQQYRSLKRAK